VRILKHVCRCKTCGEYIYKGKKFNARKETVMNELYMGLPIFRFYIKCTRCLAEITFKVKPLQLQLLIDSYLIKANGGKWKKRLSGRKISV
jgi:hypothetical protein